MSFRWISGRLARPRAEVTLNSSRLPGLVRGSRRRTQAVVLAALYSTNPQPHRTASFGQGEHEEVIAVARAQLGGQLQEAGSGGSASGAHSDILASVNRVADGKTRNW